jgi:hypothetical protein
MKLSGGGFEPCYNAQAGVDAPTMLVVATGLTQALNDKQKVTPMIKTLQDQQARLGNVKTLIADTGFGSESNVNAWSQAGIEPLIAQARQDHHPHWRERFTEPSALQADATAMQAMAHRLKTQAGKAAYALRQANGGARLWHHQVGDGVQTVLAARFAQSQWRMESGLPGLECQAHGRAASKRSITQGNVGRGTRNLENQVKTAYFLSRPKAGQTFQPLCPTGC